MAVAAARAVCILVLVLTAAPSADALLGDGCAQLSVSVPGLLDISLSSCLRVEAPLSGELVVDTASVAGDLIVDLGDVAAASEGNATVSVSFPSLTAIGGTLHVVGTRADSVVQFAQLTAVGAVEVATGGSVAIEGLAAVTGDVSITGRVGRVAFPNLATVTGDIFARGSAAAGIVFARLAAVSGRVVVDVDAGGRLDLALGAADGGR